MLKNMIIFTPKMRRAAYQLVLKAPERKRLGITLAAQMICDNFALDDRLYVLSYQGKLRIIVLE